MGARVITTLHAIPTGGMCRDWYCFAGTSSSSLPTPARWLIVAADAITDIDVTAAESLAELHRGLQQRGVELYFGGLKGPVRDRLARYGLLEPIGADHFAPTVGSAVNLYRSRQVVDWKDWDEV